MQIQFRYDKKTVIQALRYHFISRSEIRTLLILVNIFAIIAATLFYFHKVLPLAFLLSSILWIGLMISFWYILPNMVYRKNSTFKDGFSMRFDDQRVYLETERGYTEWLWNKFSTFIESPHFIHLYFDSKSFFLVPKAACKSPEDLVELRQLLSQKIPKRR